jgi:Flp pilus assembly protein TadB
MLTLGFAASCVAIVVNQVVTDPLNSFIGLAAVAAGLPVYYFWVAPRGRTTRGAIAT